MNSRSSLITRGILITVAAAVGVVYIVSRGGGMPDLPEGAADTPATPKRTLAGDLKGGTAATEMPAPQELVGLAHPVEEPGAARGQTPERMPAPEAASPEVVVGRVNVRGDLDKKVVTRITRGRLAQVKLCYQTGLQGKPGLAGRVVVQFTISPAGKVVSSVVQTSTLRNREVEACIARAVRRWIFPPPGGGGIAIVSLPLVFNAAGDQG